MVISAAPDDRPVINDPVSRRAAAIDKVLAILCAAPADDPFGEVMEVMAEHMAKVDTLIALAGADALLSEWQQQTDEAAP